MTKRCYSERKLLHELYQIKHYIIDNVKFVIIYTFYKRFSLNEYIVSSNQIILTYIKIHILYFEIS